MPLLLVVTHCKSKAFAQVGAAIAGLGIFLPQITKGTPRKSATLAANRECALAWQPTRQFPRCRGVTFFSLPWSVAPTRTFQGYPPIGEIWRYRLYASTNGLANRPKTTGLLLTMTAPIVRLKHGRLGPQKANQLYIVDEAISQTYARELAERLSLTVCFVVAFLLVRLK